MYIIVYKYNFVGVPKYVNVLPIMVKANHCPNHLVCV